MKKMMLSIVAAAAAMTALAAPSLASAQPGYDHHDRGGYGQHRGYDHRGGGYGRGYGYHGGYRHGGRQVCEWRHHQRVCFYR